jgi:MtN3 and saliva related transmembrane protein
MAGQNASIESIGILSGLIGCLSIIPQIYKSYTSGSSQDLSTSTFILLYIAYTLAVIYGICINHIAVYLSDSVALILYVILHSTKIYNEREVYIKYYYKIVNNVELQEDNIQLTSIVTHI